MSVNNHSNDVTPSAGISKTSPTNRDSSPSLFKKKIKR